MPFQSENLSLKIVFQVLMHTSEVGRITSDLASSLGLEWDGEDFDAISSVANSFKFPMFLAFLEGL